MSELTEEIQRKQIETAEDMVVERMKRLGLYDKIIESDETLPPEECK